MVGGLTYLDAVRQRGAQWAAALRSAGASTRPSGRLVPDSPCAGGRHDARLGVAVVLLGAVALGLRLGALFVHRGLSFDDGVYGASTVAMRHGLVPYRDLFSAQGPLFSPLLFVGDLIGLRAQNGPRIVPVLAGIVTPIAVWATARRLGARPSVSFVAGLFVATTGSMLWTTGPATADGPAAAFTASAVYAAVACRARPTVWKATVAGALLGAGLATKPLMFPAVIPVAIWAGLRQEWSARGRARGSGRGGVAHGCVAVQPFAGVGPVGRVPSQ